MSKVNHLSNGKSIMILGTVVGCLSLLWPKVFYPMIQGGFPTNIPDTNIKTKIHPRMKASGTTSNNHQSGFHGPSTSYHSAEQSSVSGASVGIIMTVYTAGIILLFVYTIFKYISADNSIDMEECDQRQLVKNFDQDSKAKEKKGKPSFNEYNHEQGECLKGLALNYVRCKQKLDPEEKKAPTTEEDVSMAYRVLLGDMLELRDYLVELQCTGSCQDCDSQCPDCEICQNEANEASKFSNSTRSTSDIDENQGTNDENDDSFSEQLQNVNDDSKESEEQSDRTNDECDSDVDICQTNEEDVEE